MKSAGSSLGLFLVRHSSIRKNPTQMPKPLYLTLFDVEGLQLISELHLEDEAPFYREGSYSLFRILFFCSWSTPNEGSVHWELHCFWLGSFFTTSDWINILLTTANICIHWSFSCSIHLPLLNKIPKCLNFIKGITFNLVFKQFKFSSNWEISYCISLKKTVLDQFKVTKSSKCATLVW